ncbi:MAG TPA: FMN-binding protein [Petrotogaceae bacterium]|nr:FMN-binding protein [Petrotogaceae bacterium]
MKKTKKRKGKPKMLITLAVIIGVVAVGLTSGILWSLPGMREIEGMKIESIDSNRFKDGVYTGKYIGSKDHLRDTELQVSIDEGKISDIKVIKGALDKNGQPVKLTGGKTVEDLFDRVLSSQSLQVDVISGATLTSKTHLKALEDALKKAQE